MATIVTIVAAAAVTAFSLVGSFFVPVIKQKLKTITVKL